MTKDNHFTEKELARRWGFAPKTIQKWRWSGLGPDYIRIRGRIRYTKQAIENFENKNLYPSKTTNSTFLMREVSYA